MTDKKLPQDLTPINIHAYFYNAFNACGCWELEDVIDTVHVFLEWCGSDGYTRSGYDNFYYNTGAYYLIIGLLEDVDLVDHGTSARHPWLTEDGKRFLAALATYSSYEIINHPEGRAYDGITYNIK